MWLLKILISTFILFPLASLAQKERAVNKAKDDSLNEKMMGNYVQQIMDYADSLRILSDSLKSDLDSLNQRPSSSRGVKNLAEDLRFYKNSTIYIAGGLMFSGLFLMLSFLFFLYKIKQGLGNYAFQIFGLIIVVNAALFVVVTGYDRDQITPIVGLLGTIVGFIFGSNLTTRTDKKTDSRKNDENREGER